MKSKICVVGLGYWGPLLVRNFSNIENVDLYVYDLDEKRKMDIVGKYDVKVFRTFKEMLDSNVDAVILATNPLSTHYELGKQILMAGKHLWLEKPMTATTDEAEELIKLAKENKVLLHVDHTFEYSPHIRQIKRILDAKELGDILYVSMDRLNLGLYQQDYDVIWDLCPHDFSILNYWFGIPNNLRVMESCKSFDYADIANIHLSYDTFVVDIRASWRHYEKVRKTVIVGSKKILVYDDVAIHKIIVHGTNVEYKDGKYQYFKELTPDPKIYELWEPLAKESEHFVKCIQKGIKTDTPGESGLAVMRLLEKCL